MEKYVRNRLEERPNVTLAYKMEPFIGVGGGEIRVKLTMECVSRFIFPDMNIFNRNGQMVARKTWAVDTIEEAQEILREEITRIYLLVNKYTSTMEQCFQGEKTIIG